MGARGLARLALVTLLALAIHTAEARQLLHKHKKGHHKEHNHGENHKQCYTIAQVLQQTPSLQRFANAFNAANVPFVKGLLNDPNARATFLAVPDENLGAGDTVFDEAVIRFQQHTILDRIKPCKAKDGEEFVTLAETSLVVMKDPARDGRKLMQLSTAWTSLLDVLPLGEHAEEEHTQPVALAVEGVTTDWSTSIPATFELPASQPDGRPRSDHGHRVSHDGFHGGAHDWHPHGLHKEQRRHHHHLPVEEMVAEAMRRAEHMAAKRGAVYLKSALTSQRIKVLASVRACEGTVLIVSAFLNAPPTPDPVVAMLSQQPYQPVHKVHPHHHHHHHSGLMHALKHAFESFSRSIADIFNPHGHRNHKHCQHGKKHMKHQMKHRQEQGNEPFTGQWVPVPEAPATEVFTSVVEAVPRQGAFQWNKIGPIAGSKDAADAHASQQAVTAKHADPRTLTLGEDTWPLSMIVKVSNIVRDSVEDVVSRLHFDGTV